MQRGQSSPFSCFLSIVALCAIGYGAYWFMDTHAGDIRAKGAEIATKASYDHAYESVHVGMTGADLKAAIGAPERIESADNRFNLPEKWVYGQSHLVIDIQNGFVTDKHKL